MTTREARRNVDLHADEESVPADTLGFVHVGGSAYRVDGEARRSRMHAQLRGGVEHALTPLVNPRSFRCEPAIA